MSDRSGTAGGDQTTPQESRDETERSEADHKGDETEAAGLIDRFEHLTLFRAVLGVTVVGLLLRLVALDARPAHWDEARVAYWSYFYAETGSLGYYYEEHGPLAQIMGRWMFEVFGVTDTATRVPIAVVGGLLPLASMLYREHLRDSEVVALSVFLAGNSVLLYYSRFMRSDVLVAVFMFVALGMLVRFLDTRRYRYLYPAGVFIVLGFGSKENAIVYLLTWAGATALLADQWLHSPASGVSGTARAGQTWVWERLRGFYTAARSVVTEPTRLSEYRQQGGRYLRFGGNVVGAVGLSLLTAVFVFADRGRGVERRQLREVGDQRTLSNALGQPAEFPGFTWDTLTSARSNYEKWVDKSGETTFDTYIEFVDGFLGVLGSNAPVLVAFAVVGFAMERYSRAEPRWLVLFFGYCGAASLVGYPLGTDVSGAWAWVATHIVVPLAVPAAVGAAWLYRSGLRLWKARDTVGTSVVVLILLVVTVQAGAIVVTDVYSQPQADDNQLVQFAQAHDDLDPVVETLEGVEDQRDGPDAIVYYGLKGTDYDNNEALVNRRQAVPRWDIRPTCSDWSNLQPMNWYFAATETAATCLRDSENLTAAIEQNPPPVVVGDPDDYTLPERALDGEYTNETYYLRTIGKEVVVYTHESHQTE